MKGLAFLIGLTVLGITIILAESKDESSFYSGVSENLDEDEGEIRKGRGGRCGVRRCNQWEKCVRRGRGRSRCVAVKGTAHADDKDLSCGISQDSCLTDADCCKDYPYCRKEYPKLDSTRGRCVVDAPVGKKCVDEYRAGAGVAVCRVGEAGCFNGNCTKCVGKDDTCASSRVCCKDPSAPSCTKGADDKRTCQCAQKKQLCNQEQRTGCCSASLTCAPVDYKYRCLDCVGLDQKCNAEKPCCTISRGEAIEKNSSMTECFKANPSDTDGTCKECTYIGGMCRSLDEECCTMDRKLSCVVLKEGATGTCLECKSTGEECDVGEKPEKVCCKDGETCVPVAGRRHGECKKV